MHARTGRRSKGEPSEVFATGIGERIRIARMQKGWTQAQLADESKLSSNYIARLERGELGPSLYVATQIAEALELSLTQLFESRTGPKTGKRRIAAR